MLQNYRRRISSDHFVYLLAGVILCLAGQWLFAAENVENTTLELSDLEWLDLADSRFEINGLPFFSSCEGNLYRLPLSAEKVVPQAVWKLAQSPSGGRIRLRTDSTALALRVTYPQKPGMRNMHAFGQAGIDLYVDGQYLRSIAPRTELDVEAFLMRNVSRREREITIYLPLYLGVTIHQIGIEPGSTMTPAAAFAIDKPVVFYGTSITQGGCASRPGMSYQAILGRRLNIDFVNFGFSGAGRAEPEVTAYVSEVTASCFVIDMAQNHPSAEQLQKTYLPFIEVLRSRHPDTPILCITPIYATSELPGSVNEAIYPELSVLSEMREVVRRTVQSRIADGDRNIHLLEGYSLIGPDQGDGFVDGVHPNDLGFQWMADGLEHPLCQLLQLAPRQK